MLKIKGLSDADLEGVTQLLRAVCAAICLAGYNAGTTYASAVSEFKVKRALEDADALIEELEK